MVQKNSSEKKQKVGVILMTYGTPKTLSYEDVASYLKNVHKKDVDPELITEFKRRYEVIGGSPIIEITKAQAAALEKELNKVSKDTEFHVKAGMRFSDPFVIDVVKDLSKEVDTIVGVIMSPQYSPIIMKGYIKELEDAVAATGKNMTLKMATDWHLQQNFLKAMAERVNEALKTLPENVRKHIPVLFSAHSMPKKVIDKEPSYINDLKETAAEIAKLVGLPEDRWMFCYQSAGHTPEEWLKPDFADVMPELEKKGETHVIIAPVQFLADHLEILYDVEVGAREQAEEHGITFVRTESLNTSPLFIRGLTDVVMEVL